MTRAPRGYKSKTVMDKDGTIRSAVSSFEGKVKNALFGKSKLVGRGTRKK